MSKSKKKVVIDSNLTQYDVYRAVRGSWHGVNPTTRVEENKKKYNRNKAKRLVREERSDI